MKRFEYKVLDVPVKGWFWGGRVNFQELTNTLNQLGKAGWEVTTVDDTTMYNGASRSMIIILKRELP